jgi:hypothetical protein
MEANGSGISIRFIEGWDVVVDQDPHAFSLLVCPECYQQLGGAGVSLTESMAAADDAMAVHKCSHLKVASAQGDGAGE